MGELRIVVKYHDYVIRQFARIFDSYQITFRLPPRPNRSGMNEWSLPAPYAMTWTHYQPKTPPLSVKMGVSCLADSVLELGLHDPCTRPVMHRYLLWMTFSLPWMCRCKSTSSPTSCMACYVSVMKLITAPRHSSCLLMSHHRWLCPIVFFI